MIGFTFIIPLPSSHSIAGVSVRVTDWSRRRPVIQALASDRARFSGCTLRIAQHSLRSSTLSRKEKKPFSRVSASTLSRVGEHDLDRACRGT